MLGAQPAADSQLELTGYQWDILYIMWQYIG